MKTQETKADNLARKIVKTRGICQLSGLDAIQCWGQLEWAHIVGRRNHRLRWEPEAALCICSGHHSFYTTHPKAWTAIIEKRFPEADEFVRAHRNEHPLPIWDVIDRLNNLAKAC